MSRSVAIVGAGMMGLSAGYRLAKAGHRVEVFERSNELGGLMGSITLGGQRCDRFYHVTLPTDDRVLSLAAELGLEGAFHFAPTRAAFFNSGRLTSLSSIGEFLRFRALPPQDRIRLGAFVLRCQLQRSHDDLDSTPLVPWLERTSGRRAVDRLWRPLLEARFDGRYDDLPATYIWARTRRMSGTRSGARSQEMMGTLEGGYQAMIDRLVGAIEALGGVIHRGSEVREVVVADTGVVGLRLAEGLRRFDAVLCTLLPPQARRLISRLPAADLGDDGRRYLGVACVVVKLRRSLTPYYTINITDPSVPLTGVIETTQVIDPDEVGGHLVYLPRYLDPTSPVFDEPAASVQERYLDLLRRVVPSFRDEDVLDVSVQRARLVEPVHVLELAGRPLDPFPVPGLALASTAQIYPELVNCQAVLGVSNRVVEGLLARLADRPAKAA